MKTLLGMFRPLLERSLKSPYLLVALILAVTGVAVWNASGLRVDTDLANLLPKGHPAVTALDELQATVGGENALDVGIRSPEFSANVRFTEDLIERALQLKDPRNGEAVFKRAEFRRDTEFLRKNALYLATTEELQRITGYLEDEIAKAKEQANPFLIDFFDDFEVDEPTDGGQGEATAEDADGGSGGGNGEKMREIREAYDRIIPSELPVSRDSTLLVLQLYPSGSKSNTRYLEMMFASLDSLITSMAPQTYHPEMEVRFGGRLKRHLDELDSVMGDVQRSFSSGIGSVVLLVLLSFLIKKVVSGWNIAGTGVTAGKSGTGGTAGKSGTAATGSASGAMQTKAGFVFSQILRSPVPVLLIGIPLLMSLGLTFGLVSMWIDSLNTMTSVLFVILFGLGIDYGIHFYARYIEIRTTGVPVRQAILDTYDSSGAAILASALTTSSALLILVFAEFRGFSEFGLIAGIGILMALVNMLFVLPLLLVISESWGLIQLHAPHGVTDAHESVVGATPAATANSERRPIPTHHTRTSRYPFAFPIVAIGLVIAVLSAAYAGNLRFEYEFGNLEPDFPEYREFRRFISGVQQDTRRNPAYIIAGSEQEVMEIVDSLSARKQASGPSTTLGDIESFVERFPRDPARQQDKLERISAIRALLRDPFLRDRKDEDLDLLREASQTTRPLSQDDLPDFITNRFLTKDGQLGHFVIVYPSVGLSDGRNSIAFKNELAGITLSTGRDIYPASTSMVGAEMLDLMRTESPYMVSATFVMVFVFMLLTFRSLRWSLMAAIPLVIGLLVLFGVMLVQGMMFNFYNLVVLPAILGIGCDNGIHIAARYREEGRGSVRNVLGSTGQHITIGSLTTMLGFGGLLLTAHPGLRSIGVMAVIGIGLALLVALTFLPAMIQWLEDRNWIRY